MADPMMPSPITPTVGSFLDDIASPGTGDGAGIASAARAAPNGAGMATSDYQRVLARACAIAGGEAALGAKLGVTATAIVGFLQGRQEIPTEIFLRAADIVLTASFSSALSSLPSASSSALPPSRRRPASH
jgi:hypothetical protein